MKTEDYNGFIDKNSLESSDLLKTLKVVILAFSSMLETLSDFIFEKVTLATIKQSCVKLFDDW